LFCLVIGTETILDSFLLTSDWLRFDGFYSEACTWREVLHSADWTLDIFKEFFNTD